MAPRRSIRYDDQWRISRRGEILILEVLERDEVWLDGILRRMDEITKETSNERVRTQKVH